MALVWLAVPPQSMWWWVSISVLVGAALVTMANRAVLPAILGWSLGRALLGIEVVQPDGAAVGVGRLMSRELAHLLDTLSVFVGWLWPLWDPRRRTFADLLLRTEVHCVAADRRPADIRRHAAIAVGVAVLLCVAGAAMSVFAIYLPDRAADQTRGAVNAQGPKIVTQMLTYDPKSLQAGLRAGPIADHRQISTGVGQAAGVGAKGSPGRQRVLGDRQHRAVGSTRQRDDAAVHAGPPRRRRRGTVHHRHGSGLARQGQRRPLAGRQPGRGDEAQAARRPRRRLRPRPAPPAPPRGKSESPQTNSARRRAAAEGAEADAVVEAAVATDVVGAVVETVADLGVALGGRPARRCSPRVPSRRRRSSWSISDRITGTPCRKSTCSVSSRPS